MDYDTVLSINNRSSFKNYKNEWHQRGHLNSSTVMMTLKAEGRGGAGGSAWPALGKCANLRPESSAALYPPFGHPVIIW